MADKRKDSHAALRRHNQEEARKPKPEKQRAEVNEAAANKRAGKLYQHRCAKAKQTPEDKLKLSQQLDRVASQQARRFQKTILIRNSKG